MSWIDEAPRHLLFTGKGGVGKTSLACATAVRLADGCRRVLLVSTDPASNLEQVLEAPVGSEVAPVESVPNLSAVNIDPEAAADAYRERVIDPMMDVLPEETVEHIEEQLSGACTTEIAAFDKFTKFLADDRSEAFDHVVFDRAPTEHTLLLLDTTGSYHREVMRTSQVEAGRITTPLMRLQDPDYTKILLVTVPETTPVLEAKGLQEDLERADITPYAWIVNQSLAAAGPSDPLLVERARAEVPQIEAVRNRHAERTALAPWMPEEPVGPERLGALASGTVAREPAAVA